MIAQGVVGTFGMIFTIAFNRMVIKYSMTSADADGILADLVTVEADWSAVRGVSTCNIQEGLEDTMTFFSTFGLLFFRRARPMLRAAEQRAGRALLVCDTVNMLFSPGFRILQYYSCLATSSAPCMASNLELHVQQLRRVGDQRARRIPFISERRCRLQRGGFD